jgi:hypothetical protein
MLWLKRNWVMIVMILAAFGLLGGAGYYLYAQRMADFKMIAALKQARTELQDLIAQPASLDDQNVQAVRSEIQWFKEYSPQLQPLLQAEATPLLDNVQFKSLLENTIAELNSQAESAGVNLPARYSFTFAAQRPITQFPPNSIPVLTTQLREIQELCQILFENKVHALEALKRVRAYSEEPAGSADYIDGKGIVTNGPVIITPYEIQFRGFTPELSAVLDSFQRSKTFIAVKRVTVAAIDVPVTEPVAVVNPQPGKPGAVAAKKPATTAPPTASLQTVIDEKPLRVLLTLETVRLNPTNAPAGKPAAGTLAPPAGGTMQ